MDFKNLDLEEVDKEMATDEASQSTVPEGDAHRDVPPPSAGDDVATDALTCLLAFFFFFFLGAQCVLGFLILILEQCFYSNLRTIFLPNVYGLLLTILKQCWLPIVFGLSIISVLFILNCFHSFLA